MSNKSSIQGLVEDALTKSSESELNEQQLNLLRLCRLLIKVEVRHDNELTLGEGKDGL
jgi:hypothetical protein